MNLASFLKSKAISDSDFADRVGVSRQAIHRYKNGERIPEKPVLSKIYKVTGGAVTPNDFFDMSKQSRGAA